MALFGALEQELRLDKSQFSKELSDAEREMESVDDTAQSTGSRFSSMGDQMKDAGMGLTAGVTAPLGAVGYQSLQTASDVEEMQSKMGTVFGEQTDQIKEWSKAQEEATGISELQWQEYATTLQDSFKPMGFAQDEATNMSKEVTSLAADLSSFNNMPMNEAMDRLRGGLVGNHENLERFGVMINQTSLGDQLQEMFGKGIDAATEQEKAQARLQLVMEGTSDAQGDAERTSESFANQMRALKGQVREAAAQFGEALMPAVKPLVGILKQAVEWFSGLSSEVKTGVAVVAGLAAALGPVLIALGVIAGPLSTAVGAFSGLVGSITSTIGLLSPLVALLNPVTLAIGAIVAAIGLAGIAFSDEFSGIRKTVLQGAKKIKEFLGMAITWIKTKGIPMAKTAIRRLAGMIVNGLQNLKKRLPPVVSQAVTAISNWLKTNGPPLLRQGLQMLINAAETTFSTLKTHLPPLIRQAINMAINWVRNTGIPLAKKAFRLWVNTNVKVWSEIADHLPPLLKKAIKMAITWLRETGIPLAKKGFRTFINIASRIFGEIVDKLPPLLKKAVNMAINWIRNTGIPLAKKAFRTYINILTRIWGELVDKLPPLIKKGIKMAINWVRENGPGIAKKAFNMIGTAIRLVVLGLLGAGGVLMGLFKDFLKIAADYLKNDAKSDLKTGAKIAFDALVAAGETALKALTPPDGIVVQILGDIVSYLKNDAPGDLKAAAEFLFDVVIAAAEGLWNGLIGNSVIKDMIGDIVSYFKHGAKRDLSNAAGNIFDKLSSDFKSAGEDIIDTFIDGIENKTNAVGRAVDDTVQKARDKLPGSDAKEGPLSDLTASGEALPETVAEGMTNNLRALEGSSTAVAQAATPAMAGGSARGGGAHIEIYVDGSKSPTETARAIERKLNQAGINSWRS